MNKKARTLSEYVNQAHAEAAPAEPATPSWLPELRALLGEKALDTGVRQMPASYDVGRRAMAQQRPARMSPQPSALNKQHLAALATGPAPVTPGGRDGQPCPPVRHCATPRA